MVKTCSVCKSVISYCVKGTSEDSRISHGVCHDCSRARVELKNIDEMTHLEQWDGYTSIKKAEPG
jgi:hypothetical protein